MSGYVMTRAGYAGELAVAVGPRLLTGILTGPALASHRRSWPMPDQLSAIELIRLTDNVRLLGRGGSGVPFCQKLATAVDAGRRREVVVNAAEGEPGSAKDSALLMSVPHLVLDGAEIIAMALECPVVRIAVPGKRPAVADALRAAVAERPGGLVSYEVTATDGSFVSGQARAVIELIEGRPNQPVTSWAPETVSGVRGHPTLLSNAETFAQVAVAVALGTQEYLRLGTPDEPGTTLLTVAGDGPGGVVLEVPFGVELRRVLEYCGYAEGGPVLMGGYHGTWLSAADAARVRMSRVDLAEVGASIAAGVVLPLDPASCPVTVTAQVIDYLASHGSQQCGPCRNGLPALAESLGMLSRGASRSTSRRIKELAATVTGRGACGHPDGAVRLVRSLFRAFPEEVTAHENGRCTVSSRLVRR
jgi:NADH:ubiquinone oxidoreductase subunit F (NADH-binding)